MVEGLVSIVIPIYNVEKYLDRCIESVVNQTYEKIEIILVDDGSPDSCPQKCEDWAEKDTRIRVIHKANAGLGMARNTGIEHARGEYICFFDSDDYVAWDTIENAICLAKKNCSDVVVFGMSLVGENGKIQSVRCPYTEKNFYEGTEVLDFVLPNMIEGSSKSGQNYNLNMSACTCLFSMKLITDNHWRFVSEREYISEDYYSLLRFYNYVQRVSVLKQACYFYCHNNASLTRVFRSNRYERVCHCYEAMVDMCRELHYPEKIYRSLSAQYFGSAIGAMKMIVMSSDISFAEKMTQLKRIMKSDTMVDALRQIEFATEAFNRRALIIVIKANCVAAVYLLIRAQLFVRA